MKEETGVFFVFEYASDDQMSSILAKEKWGMYLSLFKDTDIYGCQDEFKSSSQRQKHTLDQKQLGKLWRKTCSIVIQGI